MTGQSKYADCITHLRSAIVDVTETDGNKFDALMLVCDLSANVIQASFPRDEWMAALDIFLTRLGNKMDERAKEKLV